MSPGPKPFPRPKDRGLIEVAKGARRLAWLPTAFPRLKDRGLIEATEAKLKCPGCGTFPRLKDRGLIETKRSVVSFQRSAYRLNCQGIATRGMISDGVKLEGMKPLTTGLAQFRL